VKVSTICPRMHRDSIEDTGLQVMCCVLLNITFVDNSASFILPDGYYLKDGIHITRNATNKLAKHLDFTLQTILKMSQHAGGQRLLPTSCNINRWRILVCLEPQRNSQITIVMSQDATSHITQIIKPKSCICHTSHLKGPISHLAAITKPKSSICQPDTKSWLQGATSHLAAKTTSMWAM